MVSTRGLRYKFSEGERVLCYEPDPTKAKVLYDSKVLEVIESKDKRGRRTVEYLIHFQGWNSSWDRCVSEDFVLKDTEENRQLQRDLAEKSQLQLGAYLYRRERKKGSSGAGTVAGPAKRARQGFSDDGSSSSTQPDEGETGSDSSASGSASGSSGHRRSPPPNAHQGRAHIALPSALRDRLTFDYHLVVKRGRLSHLPARPCAAEILESFVKWFARAGAWHPAHAARARPDPPQRPDLLDVSCRLNLVREVADGLRVYFDFVLRGHLLYKQELNQYHEICGQFIDEQEIEMKTELEEEANSQDEGAAASAEEDMKSPKIPEYSHLPPDPVDSEKSEGSSTPVSNHELETSAKAEYSDRGSRPDSAAGRADSAASGSKTESVAGGSKAESVSSLGKAECAASLNKSESLTSLGRPDAAGGTGDDAPGLARQSRSAVRGNVARRLRSHKSAVSQSETEEPAPSTSTGEQRTFETMSSSVGSSGSSLSEAWARPAHAAAPVPTRTPLSLLLDKVAKWQIIPREGTEHLPCRVYGAIHLARLFVKLPDFLNATQMPDFKLKMILKHIDMFVQYLDEHNEWFGEMYYVADSMSRSH